LRKTNVEKGKNTRTGDPRKSLGIYFRNREKSAEGGAVGKLAPARDGVEAVARTGLRRGGVLA
jgi:hypothetical protein